MRVGWPSPPPARRPPPSHGGMGAAPNRCHSIRCHRAQATRATAAGRVNQRCGRATGHRTTVRTAAGPANRVEAGAAGQGMGLPGELPGGRQRGRVVRTADALNRQVTMGRAGRGSSGRPAHLRPPPRQDAHRARTLPRTLPLQGRPQAPERPPRPALPAPHCPHPTALAPPPSAGQDSDGTTGAHLTRAAAVSLLSATRPPTAGTGAGRSEARGARLRTAAPRSACREPWSTLSGLLPLLG